MVSRFDNVKEHLDGMFSGTGVTAIEGLTLQAGRKPFDKWTLGDPNGTDRYGARLALESVETDGSIVRGKAPLRSFYVLTIAFGLETDSPDSSEIFTLFARVAEACLDWLIANQEIGDGQRIETTTLRYSVTQEDGNLLAAFNFVAWKPNG